MKLQEFNGGIDIRKAPHMLQLNEAVVYDNVDNEAGTLKPVAKKLQTLVEVGANPYFFITEQKWFESEERRDYVEFQKALYWTDRTTGLKRYKDEVETNGSIEEPPKLEDITTTSAPEAPNDFKVDVQVGTAGTSAGVDNIYLIVNTDEATQSGALQVKVDTSGRITILATDSTNVTKPNLVKEETAETRRVTISDVDGITYGTTGVDVYRLYEGEYYLVGNLASPTASLADSVEDISGNTVFEETKFGNLKGVYQYAISYYNSAIGVESATSFISDEVDVEDGGDVTLSNLPISADTQVDKKRIYRLGGNLTLLTRVTEIDAATTSFLDNITDTDVEGSLADTDGNGAAPDDLKFLTEAYGMLFGVQGTKLRFTPIAQPWNWPETNFIEYGVDLTGIAETINGIVVMTRYRSFLVTGTGPLSLASQLLSSDQGCIAFESIQAVGGIAIWASTDGICISSGNKPEVVSKPKLGKLALNPKGSALHDEVYYALEENGSIFAVDFRYGIVFKRLSLTVDYLAIANDTLYGQIDGRLSELFGSTLEVETFTYKSPRLIEGRASEIKHYKDIYIYSKGDIIFNIFINDKLVLTKELSGEDGHLVKVPQAKQRGFFIQFEISGTGEVYEIEYEAGRRSE